MNQISAITRLQGLPEVFRGADLTVRFGWTSKNASQYLYLWKRRALVSPLGGHSDVFVNLLKSPSPNWLRAARLAMPSATIIGAEALRLVGWSTQIPARPTLAVKRTQPLYKTERFEVTPRPQAWFESIQSAVDHSLEVPVLRPAWALADMLAHGGWGSCGIWPDDLDLELASAQDEQDWARACQCFGLPESALSAQTQTAR